MGAGHEKSLDKIIIAGHPTRNTTPTTVLTAIVA